MEIHDIDGVETLYVHNASVSALTRFLNPEVRWVWVLGHMPNRYSAWWRTPIAINTRQGPVSAECRSIRYDLMLPTCRFLELQADFEDHGLVLIQSHRRMPDSLDLSRIPESHQNRVLRSNGAFLRIYLPHAIETAQVQCFDRGYLAKVAAS